MSKQKRRLGDRKDGYLVRDADTMHKFMPYIMPNRADSEAMVTEVIDMSAVVDYVKSKNYDGIEFKYTFFHVICAAVAKTIALRPKLNRFYAGKRLYQRNNISISFTVKKQFTDHSEEGLAIVRPDCDSEDSPVEQIYQTVKKICTKLRKEKKNDK
jgi:pyruvate/2-oxoglutarate dehydrogenase complex dihydrolipoamide acyltransferase (E2) component